ncbi:MAG: helix-turn-helix domain-containing protein [Actinobacteria bacterium]|nr:helix-turn-helix domain-containing protein [Actinomycetota bacterium]
MPTQPGHGEGSIDPSPDQLATAFASRIRLDIYRHLRQCGTPQLAGEVAEKFCLHRTAARAHLEKLRELGLVSISSDRRPHGGRPTKGYLAVDKRLEIMVPPRRYERLARLLLTLLGDSLDDAAAADQAAAIGRAYGEAQAAEIVGPDVAGPLTLAVKAVEEWMRRSGYDARASSDGSVAVIEIGNCVYGELAPRHRRIVCSFDRGTLCGLLGVDHSAHTQTHALSAGDPFCRHVISL